MPNQLNQLERAAVAIGHMVGSDLPVYWADHPRLEGFELRATSRGIMIRRSRPPVQTQMVPSVNTGDRES